MTTYRMKPYYVDARQVDTSDYDALCELISWCGGRADIGDDNEGDDGLFWLSTLDDYVNVPAGSWVVQHAVDDGEVDHEVLTDEEFAERYEPA